MMGLGSIADPPWEKFDLHTDHLGTVRAVTDHNGVVVSMHNYFPFGEEIAPTQFSYNNHQYTGHERDKETGLDYMLARYYEAGLGRFLSPDPTSASAHAMLPQTWNRYAYVNDNPLRLVDPTGKAGQDPGALDTLDGSQHRPTDVGAAVVAKVREIAGAGLDKLSKSFDSITAGAQKVSGVSGTAGTILGCAEIVGAAFLPEAPVAGIAVAGSIMTGVHIAADATNAITSGTSDAQKDVAGDLLKLGIGQVAEAAVGKVTGGSEGGKAAAGLVTDAAIDAVTDKKDANEQTPQSEAK
jgi:RHS repeat-associated protein